MSLLFVTGGSGFLGQHLIGQLRRTGATVRALSRSDESDSVLARLGAQPVRAALNDIDSLKIALQSVDTIFHTAADTTQWRPHNPIQTAVNVDGTQTLLAAAKSANVRLFVHTSSVSAYSHLAHGILQEDTPQRGGESWVNYEHSKYLGEKAVRESGLPHIVLNPAHIFGPGDTRNWARLIQMVDQRKLPGAPPGSGSFADVREVAKAHVAAWQKQQIGERFLLGGEQASFVELLSMIGKRLERTTPRRATPAWALKIYGSLSDALSRITGKLPQITPEAAAIACHHLQVDSSKAIRLLDYQHTPLPRLLDDTIVWMRQKNMLSGE